METNAISTLLMWLRRCSSLVSDGGKPSILFQRDLRSVQEISRNAPGNLSRAFADSLNNLDTAPNIIRYIEAIKNCLQPGGLFVNVGPLLWHFENNAPGQHGHENDSASEKSPDRSPDKSDARGS